MDKRLIVLIACFAALPPFASRPLIAHDLLQPADAIVVIGGDHKLERTQHAAQLYHSGYAALIILSAGTIVQEGTEWLPEAQVLLRQITSFGVPHSAILLEQTSQDTWENAHYIREILRAQKLRTILLVTSAYHSRRASLIFNAVWGNEFIVSVHPALHEHFCTSCWLFAPDQRSVVFYEYRNLIGYVLRRLLM